MQRNIKLETDAHSLAGFFDGLAGGVKQWRADDINEDMLKRLADALDKATNMAEDIIVELKK